jgi:hypothetical protein
VRPIVLLLSVLILCSACKRPAPGVKVPNVYEFRGEKTTVALQQLAQEAKVKLVIASDITNPGTVTCKLENVTARQTIEIITQSKGWTFQERNGVYLIKADPAKAPSP